MRRVFLFLVGAAAAVALAGCAGDQERGKDMSARLDRSGAECIGRMLTTFDDIHVSVVHMECGPRRLVFTAWPSGYADPRAMCAFAWSPATAHKGTGRLLCDNDMAGAMTFDRTDPKNIKVETALEKGGHFDFILHEDGDFPNTEPFPS